MRSSPDQGGGGVQTFHQCESVASLQSGGLACVGSMRKQVDHSVQILPLQIETSCTPLLLLPLFMQSWSNGCDVATTLMLLMLLARNMNTTLLPERVDRSSTFPS